MSTRETSKSEIVASVDAEEHASSYDDDDEPSLSKLLAALAMGARAVNNLPLGDDFDYQKAFPEFSNLNKQVTDELVDILNMALESEEHDDYQIWDRVAESCDALLEQAELYVSGDTKTANTLQELSKTACSKAKGGFGRMMENLDHEMDKPQDSYGIEVLNDRTEVWMPKVHPDKPYGSTPLDLRPVEGHGLESRGFGVSKRVLASNLIAPTHHFQHPYQHELETLEYNPWQLKAPVTKPAAIQADPEDQLVATWIDTKEQLEALVERLSSVKFMAVDLEAHSYRSFAGMTCLMQITIKDDDSKSENYLIDTLKLWHDMNAHLAPIFANPAIVKVMHGADSDIQWLQRDFGIYVVNLFDTGRAARALQLPSAGLAYLLKHYVGVEADKSLALSDWRRRPLLDEMRTYAIMDTHYLLDIYQHLMYDIEQHPTASIEQVLNDSRDVCLIRYDKEPFQPDGYKSIRANRRNSRTQTNLTSQQEQVLASLYDWRDETARSCDESLQYVCSNQALLRISMACPSTVAALQALYNPMPPLVMRFAEDVLSRVKRCLAETPANDDDEEEDDADLASPQRGVAGAPSSAYFKPAEVDDETEEHGDNGILSPVLATEEMYKQAGWMTPQITDVVTTTTDEDDADSSSKPRKLLVVDDANKGYQSSEYTKHSLAMGKDHTAGGLGAALSDKGEAIAGVDEEVRQAQINASRIRSGLSRDKALLGSISPTTELPDEASADKGADKAEEAALEESDEEPDVPRSIAEIYKRSNQLRRNKHSVSPTNLDRNQKPPEKFDVDTLEGVEAMLAASGYYKDGVGGKRQRTKSDTGEGGGNGGPHSREENIEFMEELGWIESKEDLEAKMKRPNDEQQVSTEKSGEGEESAERESPTDGSRTSSTGNKSGSPFDYSTIGSIGVYPQGTQPASNPFFGGAAVAPAPAPASTSSLQQAASKRPQGATSQKKIAAGRGKSAAGRGGGGKQERPEKKDGRAFVYKKR